MKKIKLLLTIGAFLFSLLLFVAFKPSSPFGKSVTTGWFAFGRGGCNFGATTDQANCYTTIETNLCTVTFGHIVHSPAFEMGGTECVGELYYQ
jgi:hypothetical protein